MICGMVVVSRLRVVYMDFYGCRSNWVTQSRGNPRASYEVYSKFWVILGNLTHNPFV
jgi:hypothetical protein